MALKEALPFSTLLVTMFTTVMSSSDPIPVFTASGIYYDVGFQIGQKFAKNINEYYAENADLQASISWSKTEEGKKVVSGYQDVCRKYFPEYIDELRGMSEGTQIPFSVVFLAQLRVELKALLANSTSTPEGGACSDVMVNGPDLSCQAFGHNEDNTPIIRGKAYFLEVHIKVHGKEEHFLAYSYPGELPGNAFAFNAYGLSFSVNSLYPKTVLMNRIPRSFLTRAMLSKPASDFQNLTSLFEMKGVGSAYGFSVNIGVTSGEQKGTLWNFETAPDPSQPSAIVNRLQITPSSKPAGEEADGSYFHVNKYRRISIAEIAKSIKSSVHRSKRLEELPPQRNVSDILSALGDTKDKEFPIFRRPSATDPGETLCTGLFDLRKCRLDIYGSNPKSGDPPVNAFNLLDCQPHGDEDLRHQM